MKTFFEREIIKEIKLQKNDYWDKISRKLPTNARTNSVKTSNTNFKFYLFRLMPLAVSGVIAIFAFFVITNFNKVAEINPIKKQNVKLSALIKMRDAALEESEQGTQPKNSESDSAKNQLQSTIKYISEK